ncbi:hypothetical protein GA0074694_3196 [Micromonospora inyonensis]|uniref:Uncharacterized protein n=1 Tax=Micromonospora inyonensis TaxID=47866 RepID=A0A1C6RXJ3_9ACTN|nr:hypothetical protein GA0074694_3196 [Micromonospora inyonensis]
MKTRPTLENQTPETMPTAVCVTTGLRRGPQDEDADGRALRDILGADVDHELVDFAAGAGGTLVCLPNSRAGSWRKDWPGKRVARST